MATTRTGERLVAREVGLEIDRHAHEPGLIVGLTQPLDDVGREERPADGVARRMWVR
jgi:hypothetical protein